MNLHLGGIHRVTHMRQHSYATEVTDQSHDACNIHAVGLCHSATETAVRIGVDLGRPALLDRTGHDFSRSGNQAPSRPPRLGIALIAGLVALSAADMTAAGFAIYNAAGTVQNHAIALTRLSANLNPLGAVARRSQAVSARNIFLTDQMDSVMATFPHHEGDMLTISSGVTGIAFSSDGKLLASAYSDGTIRLWDLATRQLDGPVLRADSGTQTSANAIAFSPDGKLLASAYSDGTIRLWDLATRQLDGPVLRADSGTQTSANAIAFSPDGKLLASAYSDGTIRLWDLATRQLDGPVLRADSGTQTSANAIAFSPDGKLLASAYSDGTIRLWDPATRQLDGPVLRADSGTQTSANAIAFSPDGKLLASAYSDGTIRLWNPATGHPLDPPLPVGSSATGIAFSPDGTLMVSADADGTVQLWNPATRQPVGPPRLVGSSADGVAFSPDGELLASADADGIVQFWPPATGEPVGPGPGDWFAIVASGIAIAFSALAVAITVHEIRLARVILE